MVRAVWARRPSQFARPTMPHPTHSTRLSSYHLSLANWMTMACAT
jgi:hypothetical protein